MTLVPVRSIASTTPPAPCAVATSSVQAGGHVAPEGVVANKAEPRDAQAQRSQSEGREHPTGAGREYNAVDQLFRAHDGEAM